MRAMPWSLRLTSVGSSDSSPWLVAKPAAVRPRQPGSSRSSRSRLVPCPTAVVGLAVYRRSRQKICRCAWDGVEWVKLGEIQASLEKVSSSEVELPIMPLPAVYLPSPSQQLMISEPRYLKLYDDILMNGSRMFAVCHYRGSKEKLLARVGLVFRLTNLKDVAQETNGHTRYVAEHEVRRRVRILSVENPEDQDSKTAYLRAKVEFLDDNEEEDSIPDELRVILQRISGLV